MVARMRKYQGKTGGRRRGLSIVEVLVCLTISSMLLTAMGVTYLGSFNSYRDAQERGGLNANGRTFMRRIIADIRMSDVHGPYDLTSATLTTEQGQFNSQIMPGTPTSGLPSAGGTGINGIQMIKTHADTQDPNASTATPITITYWLDTTHARVMATRQVGAAAATATVVCTGVQNFQVFMQPVYVPANPATGTAGGVALLRAVVKLTLANTDGNGGTAIQGAGRALTITMTDAAMPRKGFATQ